MMKKKHTVVVFTSPGCSWCRRVKQYLRDNHISFKEIDISRNVQAARDIMNRTGQAGVPVVLIDNRPIVGFNKPIIDKCLGIKSSS